MPICSYKCSKCGKRLEYFKVGWGWIDSAFCFDCNLFAPRLGCLYIRLKPPAKRAKMHIVDSVFMVGETGFNVEDADIHGERVFLMGAQTAIKAKRSKVTGKWHIS